MDSRARPAKSRGNSELSPRALHFGPYRLASLHGPLYVDDGEVRLPPKALAVLWLLASHGGQVLTKAALLDGVWGETAVGEDALAFQIQVLRQALNDDARNPRYIETVHRVGYRFIAPVTTAPSVFPSGAPAAVTQRDGSASLPPAVPALVGREAELERLHTVFAKASRGERQIALITGEPGIGKTALAETFLASLARGRAREAEIRVGRGQCVEQYGAGEAYLPLLEALGRLCRGPRGAHVVETLRQYAPSWLVQMPGLVDEASFEALRRAVHGITRDRMQREIAEGLEALAAEEPVVLLLEDLHWSDVSTVGLLEMVARRREAARLFVVGTYRPVDLIIAAHPLKTLKHELVARGRAVEVSLGYLSAEAVHAFVAKRLEEGTRGGDLAALVYRRTDGHPLFMVHVTEYLVQQGAPPDPLAANVGPAGTLEEAVPQALRELIEAQLGRLPEEERRVLEVASVAGSEFVVAGVAAGGQQTPDRVEALCEGLARQGQFIDDRGLETWPDGTVGGRYGFRHALYRDVLYDRLGPGQRARLHLAVGTRKAMAFGDRGGEIAAELALHFEHAGDGSQAAQYHRLAGDKALRQQAYHEALMHTERGLALLQDQAAGAARLRQELELHITRGAALVATRGFSAPEVEPTYTRAHTLSRELADAPTLGPALFGLWNFYLTRADLPQARDLADQLAMLADRQSDPMCRLQVCNAGGTTAMFMGDLVAARALLERGLGLYDRAAHQALVTAYGEDPGIACSMFAALTCWLLGYPGTARRHLDAGMQLAQALGYPFGVAEMLWADAVVSQQCGDPRAVRDTTERLISLCLDKDFPVLLAGGRIVHGWTLAQCGDGEEGIDQIRQGMTGGRATGLRLTHPYSLALQAVTCAKAGRIEEGLEALDQALDRVQGTGERWYEAELHRLKGELTLRSPRIGRAGRAEAEACFLRATEIARGQHARSLELRAVMSLSRLAREQGGRPDVRHKLAEVYDWFTEGFDTADLYQARALLGAS